MRAEVALRTEHRTPLGRVVVARLLERGTVEVAGPVAAQDVGEVVETMRRLGAGRVLVDGSIDRARAPRRGWPTASCCRPARC